MKSDLTPKQRRFVEEYLIDLNGTQAAIRAGYSAKTAGQIAEQNLKKVEIAAEVSSRRAKLSDKLEITAERVVRELSLIGFCNMQDYMRIGADGDPYLDFSALTRDQAAALSEVTVEDFKDGRGDDARDVRRVKFKLSDKRAALVDLGKHLGLFRERVELTGKDGGAIEVNDARDTLLSRVAGIATRSRVEVPPGAGKPH